MKPRFLPGFLAKGRCISLEMLRAGWAVTYEQAGAEYGDAGKDEHLRIQAEAQCAILFPVGVDGTHSCEIFQSCETGHLEVWHVGRNTRRIQTALCRIHRGHLTQDT